MNFISAFNELDKLYESVDLDQLQEDVDEEVVEEAEEATTEEPIEEPVEETEEEVVNKPIVLECIKCGALVIKDESEVTIDEESDLANVGEECSYCEESEGFKAIGTFEPYVVETVDDEAVEEAEAAEDDVVEEALKEETTEDEELEEGIFDRFKKNKNSKSNNGKSNNLRDGVGIYYANDTSQIIQKRFKSQRDAVKWVEEHDMKGKYFYKPCKISDDDLKESSKLNEIQGWADSEHDGYDWGTSREWESLQKEDLEEGIFDKKKNSAEMNNARRDFSAEVEAITGGDSLADMAYELTSKLRDSIDDYKYYEEKKANHTTDQISLQRVYKSKAEQILKLYAELIKTLKKPTNFYAPYSVISSAIRKVLGGYSSDSDILSRIRDYGEKLNKIGAIKADKKVKSIELADFYKKVVNGLDGDYRLLQKKPTHTLFN